MTARSRSSRSIPGLAGAMALTAVALLTGPTLAQSFDADSRFAANSLYEPAVHRFDLEMRIELWQGGNRGEFSLFVNSRDGTMAVLDPELVRWAFGAPQIPQTTLHFGFKRPGDSALVCGRHEQHGDACIQAGGTLYQDPLFSFGMEWEGVMDFLESEATTPQQALEGEGPPDHLPVTGMFGEHRATLWLSPRSSGIATQRPFLGFGVGLIKDYRTNVNRIVRQARIEGAGLDGDDLFFRLVDIRPANRSFDTGRYGMVSAFGTDALRSAEAFPARIEAHQRRLRALEEGMSACGGAEVQRNCRASYRERIRAERQAFQDEVRTWARDRGLPVPD